ncbi:DUF1631 family protein [Scleromatobacter humisilvae]|uniref:DUF1631 domain-containing protein n=1 Tax=Scleromatobacter humisilvae TaxID=2897159 RepID=A0A9X1YI41_9BURK|nr:DUF1631 family protein [Scleromatobacter humisilvae]MCK9685300.1 DUF1631 domain-containing protein [Scleromatobacter humisilvae]
MTKTAYERHLERAHSLMSRRVRSGASGLGAEITSAPVANAALRALRGEVAAAIARQHAQFSAAFADALLQAFTEFTQPPAAKAPGQWLDLGSFEIMDESRIQDEIEVAQVVRILDEDCAVELRRLIKFEAALRRHEGVRVAASPIGPPCLARALWTASEGLGVGAPVRAELVRSMARWLAPRLNEIYAAVRQAGFADASHLEAADRAADVADEAVSAARPTGFDVTRPGALFELMDLDEQRPVFEASTAPLPFAHVADTLPMPLDGDDTRLPGLIHSHREELAALQDATSARLGVALIGHLFVQIVADPALSNDAREWIARLQPVVVRLATQDATLLQSHRHPAWTLVNRIVTHMRADKDAPAPEFTQWLADSVAQVSAEPSTAHFQAAVDRLAQWQRKQAQKRLTSVEGALDLLRRNASLEELVGQARARLQRKLDSAQPPSKTRRFILTLWSLVVAQEWTTLPVEARRNSPAMDTAVDIIWSTDAARSRADASTLVAMIPELVERVTAGMATVKLSDAMRKAWLDQIAAIHLHAMRRPEGAEAAGGPVTVDLELDDELPPAPPPPAPEPAPDASSPLANLQVGDTISLQLHGEWTDLQLLWTSDNGYFLLFAGSGEASRSFTRKALEKMVAQGLLRAADANSALQRAGDKIIRGRQ